MTPLSHPTPVFNTQSSEVMRLMREFFRMESAAGLCLVLAAVLAMIVANTPLSDLYHYVLHDVKFTIGFDGVDDTFHLSLSKSLLHWINDGMMAIFFFLVGLEIKREFKEGQLSSRARALLPLLAAAGGMAAPAAVFLFFTRENPALQHGWAIPAATDIAFTLGVLALLGSRVPFALKILVTAIAVVDDLGAIVIIALFYSGDLFLPALWVALSALALLIWMNRYGVARPAAYVLVGFLLWVAVLKTGAHATLAGVITALCVPMRDEKQPHLRPCEHLEHILHPWVAFMILPIFAFANAGVSLAGITVSKFADPLVLGIAAGLFIGKQIGIFGVIWTAIRLRLCPMPEGVTWMHLYGMSILCGIGFTMSLFIGGLAYGNPALQVDVRLGVILGSVVSAGLGYLILRRTAIPAH